MPTAPLIITDSTDDTSAAGPWLSILKKYGLATFLSLVFAYFLIFVVHGQLKANGEKTDAVKAALAQHSADMHIDQAAARVIQEQLLRATIANCRNAAESNSERELCGEVPK